MTYSDHKESKKKAIEKIMKENGVFWAFGNEQFKAGIVRCNLAEGEKVTDIGGGGYLPSKNVDNFLKEMNEIEKFTGDRVEAIKYELNNHEYAISMDAEQCIKEVFEILDACTDGISMDLVKDVARYKG